MNNFNSFINTWLKGNGFAKFCLRIAFITLVLGSLALTISFSVIEGFHKTILDNAFKYDSHIKIQKSDKETISDFNAVKKVVLNSFPDAKVYPVLNQLCLTKINDQKDAFFIKGIPKELIEKRYDLDTNFKEIIYLPNSYKGKVASSDNEIVFVFNNKIDMNYRVKKKYISGFYSGGFGEIDKNVIITDLNTSKEIINYQNNECDEIEIVLPDGIPSNIEMNKLILELGYDFNVQSFRDIHWLKIQWIEVQKDPISIALALISLVAISNIITGLLVLVVDKFKSIGLLRSLGVSKFKLLRIFFTKGIQFGLFSSLTGYIIGFLIGQLQNHFELIRLDPSVYFIDSFQTIFQVHHFFLIIITTTIISGLASLIPAYLAIKMEPIKAIRSI